jgi:superfamily II DNA or RNA helicase
VKLVPGLYESAVTAGLDKELQERHSDNTTREALTEDNAPHVLSRMIHDASFKALRSLPKEQRLEAQVAFANGLLELIGEKVKDSGVSAEDHLKPPGELLLEIRDAEHARLGTGLVTRPTLPLRHSDLLVNGPRDLRVGHEVRLELASADRVDLLISFIKWSGFRLIRSELKDFLERRPGKLRVLTTTYLGATDPDALEALRDLGADVRVSYDARRTRLHAKAWLFHRNSGFSTGIIGSSNLSTSALLDGCEWNVRLSNVDNPAILSKFLTTFDQYWEDPQFEPYDRARFEQATQHRNADLDALARVARLSPLPHQQITLDELATERSNGHMRNLVVAATGTGKTVIAALDFARLHKGDPTLSLLFVAHRREILRQSLATFRAATRDGNFGELLVGDERPLAGRHVFASIQALHRKRLATLAHDAYDVVIVDEFHHAEADTYRDLLEHLKPRYLLGLTATPERTDGKSVLGWFDQRIASEVRLWNAIELGLVVPFQYFGLHDDVDLSTVDFRAGRYDVDALEKLYTADDARARAVLRGLERYVSNAGTMRALGFCVSVKHAEFMAAYFTRHGLPAQAVSAETPDTERTDALRKLQRGELRILFSRDLFNEGVDVPAVDTVLFLRPTESATVFLQQLGRGLRHEEGKSCLTVLDFVGAANREFRFDERFRALLGIPTRAGVLRAVEEGFPHLPAGCEIRLEPQSQQAVLTNVRAHLGSATADLIADLKRVGDVRLPEFLQACELSPEELYRSGTGRTLENLKRQAGLRSGQVTDDELHRSFARLLHVDDEARLKTWRSWLAAPHPPTGDNALRMMLFVSIGFARRPVSEADACFAELWRQSGLRQELADLLGLLADRTRKQTFPLDGVPFRVHATYSRDEISAGLGEIRRDKLMRTQGGVYKSERLKSDIFYVTLEKDPKHFTPTTLYNDYPISPTRFHWETQSVVRADSDTGRRYRNTHPDGWRRLLFVRQAKTTALGVTAPYLFLGPVTYVTHESEKPMRITWELETPMPASFFNETKIAAG